MSKQKFQPCFILSPDEIPFSPEPIKSFSELRKAWSSIKLRYSMQGYYSCANTFLGERMRIPINKLHRYCMIVPAN